MRPASITDFLVIVRLAIEFSLIVAHHNVRPWQRWPPLCL